MSCREPLLYYHHMINGMALQQVLVTTRCFLGTFLGSTDTCHAICFYNSNKAVMHKTTGRRRIRRIVNGDCELAIKPKCCRYTSQHSNRELDQWWTHTYTNDQFCSCFPARSSIPEACVAVDASSLHLLPASSHVTNLHLCCVLLLHMMHVLLEAMHPTGDKDDLGSVVAASSVRVHSSARA